MDGEPVGKSLVRSSFIGNDPVVSLLDLEAAAVRCERSYDDPELRWHAWRTMLEGLRQGMTQIEIPKHPRRD